MILLAHDAPYHCSQSECSHELRTVDELQVSLEHLFDFRRRFEPWQQQLGSGTAADIYFLVRHLALRH